MIEFIKNLSTLELVLIGIAVLFIGRVIYREIQFFRLYQKLVKSKKKRLKELEEKKCKGPHSWIDIELNGQKTHVCKECYYSPKNEGFVREEYVNAYLEELKYREAMEEYMEVRLKDIAAAHKIENPRAVYDAMVTIKKDFNIEYMEKKIKELLSEDE